VAELLCWPELLLLELLLLELLLLELLLLELLLLLEPVLLLVLLFDLEFDELGLLDADELSFPEELLSELLLTLDVVPPPRAKELGS
jgi:hypothetical protein